MRGRVNKILGTIMIYSPMIPGYLVLFPYSDYFYLILCFYNETTRSREMRIERNILSYISKDDNPHK